MRESALVHEELTARLRRDVDVEEGHIPAYIFRDPDIYQLELDRVFGRCWLFVAHESEVPEPGDYVTRYLGTTPVIVVRAEDGQIRVLLNVCRHRGMRVCRADLGNASHFRCPYHGFTYKNSGELVGVPFQQLAYGDRLERKELGLVQARAETYSGLIFATFDERVQSLTEYLGDVRWYLDLYVGRADMEVFGPPQRWEMPTNWKIPAENAASDAYHTAHTHASLPKIGLIPGGNRFAESGYHVYAGNGHGLGLGMPGDRLIFPAQLVDTYRRRLSPEQCDLLLALKNSHCTVFPNLSFVLSSAVLGGEVVSHLNLQLWQPRAPDRIEVMSWGLVERDAPPEWKERSRQHYVLTFGASGIFEQDDAENWTDITRNCSAPVTSKLRFVYLQGMGRPRATSFPGPGEVYESKFSENNARGFYGRWLELMLDGE